MDVFAEVEPNQKERIILALKKAGNVVGYMGDGINDASALHAADVGISVDSAVDVAKEAADIVLLEKDLDVLVQGVREGRATFANTLKYVFMATSANFGNMFSMAGASLFLPFLPAAAQADPAHQPDDRLPRDDHRHRQRGRRDGGAAAALGHPLHPQLHADLRPGQLGLRLPHLRRAAAPPARHAGAVPDRLVPGVGHLGVADRARDPDAAAVLQEQAGPATC